MIEALFSSPFRPLLVHRSAGEIQLGHVAFDQPSNSSRTGQEMSAQSIYKASRDTGLRSSRSKSGGMPPFRRPNDLWVSRRISRYTPRVVKNKEILGLFQQGAGL